MNTNAIDQIRNAELNAEALEKEAAAAAQKAVEQARSDAAAIIERAKADGLAMVEKAVADAKLKAADIGGESRGKLDTALKELERIAEKKQSEAIELVKKKLISD